jgi:hypothetical protein
VLAGCDLAGNAQRPLETKRRHQLASSEDAGDLATIAIRRLNHSVAIGAVARRSNVRSNDLAAFKARQKPFKDPSKKL